MASMTLLPPTNPKTLEKTRPIITFCHPVQTRTEEPAEARPAPAKPATRAWLSLVGMPHRAATLDQTTIPTIAPPTVVRVTALGSMMSLPMVAATAVPDSTPRRLKTDAMARAPRGDRARVPTTVAMALGASVQPLTNSAARISSSTTSSSRLISMPPRSIVRQSIHRCVQKRMGEHLPTINARYLDTTREGPYCRQNVYGNSVHQ